MMLQRDMQAMQRQAALGTSAVGVALCTTFAAGLAGATPVVVDIPDVTLGSYDLAIGGSGTLFSFANNCTFGTGEICVFFTNTVSTTNAIVGYDHVHNPADPTDPKSGTYASALAAGETIDGTRSYVTNSAILSAKDPSAGAGEFYNTNGARYVGLRFGLPTDAPGSLPHYGWVEAFGGSGQLTLTRYGYESDVGAGIRTPDAAVPEPGSLALLVAGAAGVLSMRRRRPAA